MMKDYYRDSIMEIDLDKMKHNIKLIKNNLSPDKFMYSVVKGNAYGYGILQVTRISIESGCDGIGVATLDEGMVVRKHFPDIPILVIGVVRKEDVVDCAQANIRITIPNLDFAQHLSKVELPIELKVHLKVNSGMNRIGLNNLEEVKEAIKLLESNPKVNINGIFTHYATADYVNDSQKVFFENQLSFFKNVLKELDYPFEQIHCTNSASALRDYKEFAEFTTTTRLGWAFSGMVEDYSQDNYDILPVMKVKSKVVHIASYSKGAYLGYANKYQVVKEGLYYAVIPIGYADGIDPAHSGCKVKCNNQYGTIVGKICMDQITLEFEEPVAIGDEVILIDGEDSQLDLFQRAKEQGVITIAVMEKFTTRLPKVYYENGKIYKIENAILNQ